ncbi:MAG: carbonic anhydrase, partial [Hydrogenophaga sp.]|nr:carbonic anhydrase [Hydrogenophaga sp.]
MCKFCITSDPQNKTSTSPSRRSVLGTMGALSLLGMSAVAGIAHAKTPPKPDNVLSPDQALKRLMDGNERYISGQTQNRSFAKTRE